MSDDFEIGEIRDMLSGVIDAEDGGLESDELCPDTVSISAIQERYIDSALAGTGALKNVYKCYDVVMDRYVALAELQDKHGKALYDAFVYEARLTASLSHPNIIKVHDIGVHEDGRPFFTMDLKSGVHLGEHTRHLSIDKKLDVFNLICGAIAHAHSKGIVHLDLKPENIQCDAYGEVLVCDWGLSKALIEGGRRLATMGNMELIEVAHMTLYGELKGSPGYMAPEQIEQGEKDARTDIYALGAILYYLCTGQKVFTGDVATVLKATVDTVPQKASSVNRALPSSLSMVIMKCLEKRPDDRYQNVDQLVSDLERYRSGRSTSIERGDVLKESTLFCQRNSQKLVLAMVVLLILSLFYIWNDRRLEAQELEQSIAQAKIEQINEDLIDVVEEYDAFEKALTESKRDLSLRLYDTAYTRWQQFYGKLESAASVLDLIDEIALLTRKAA